MSDKGLPASIEKPSLRQWLETFLPFSLPHIPLIQTAKNLDLAIARVVGATGFNVEARINRNRAVVDARKQAETTAIDAASVLAREKIAERSELAERALDYTYYETILRQQSRELIANQACEELKRDPPTSDATKEIDFEWLNQFSRLAENISSADLQSMWAKILAGEIRQPGTFRMRTLQEVAMLSRDEAELFHRVLSHAINKSFVYRDKDTLSVSDAITCETLGILTGAGGTLNLSTTFPKDHQHHYVCGNRAILASATEERKVAIRCYPLTTFGKELLEIMGPTPANEDYMKRLGIF